MLTLKDTCRIAVVQAAPVMFDSEASTEKAVDLTSKAAEKGAELIVFPELFIPGYPYGITYGFTVGSRRTGKNTTTTRSSCQVRRQRLSVKPPRRPVRF
jgi:predicted amidohydrolase